MAKIREYQEELEEQERSLILFDCKMGAGHFGSSGRYAFIKEIAAEYAFVVDQLTLAKTNYLQANIANLKLDLE